MFEACPRYFLCFWPRRCKITHKKLEQKFLFLLISFLQREKKTVAITCIAKNEISNHYLFAKWVLHRFSIYNFFSYSKMDPNSIGNWALTRKYKFGKTFSSYIFWLLYIQIHLYSALHLEAGRQTLKMLVFRQMQGHLCKCTSKLSRSC